VYRSIQAGLHQAKGRPIGQVRMAYNVGVGDLLWDLSSASRRCLAAPGVRRGEHPLAGPGAHPLGCSGVCSRRCGAKVRYFFLFAKVVKGGIGIKSPAILNLYAFSRMSAYGAGK
jgi:hypothetical protein